MSTTIGFPSKNQVEGKGLFRAISLVETNQYGQNGWLFKGTLVHFSAPNENIYNIPCKIYLKNNHYRPRADCDYIIEGSLKNDLKGNFTLKPLSDQWERIPHWNLTEWRFQAKQTFKEYLIKKIPSQRASLFLTGLFSGLFEDRIMMKEFGNLGLQHILAISGFHFSFIAFFLFLILRTFLPPQFSAYLLLILLTIYFVFIGLSSSVLRAYISFAIVILSQLMNRKSSGLNCLGIGLMIILIIDPLSCRNLGFQFSFLSTAAILIFLPLFNNILRHLFIKRNYEEVLKMPSLDQHGYVLLSIIKSGIALNLAVHLATIPLCLYHFHQFPILSLIYNLFFPFLASIALLLLLISFLIIPFPYCADAIHLFNSYYTEWILQFIETPPLLLKYTFFLEQTPEIYLFSYYFFLLMMTIFCYKTERI